MMTTPNSKDVIRGHTGWYIFDRNGFCSGPYKSAVEACQALSPQKKES